MWTTTQAVASILTEHHYLGASRRGTAWQDDFGVIVIAAPTARRLPSTWVELVRWCITSKDKNAGSRQWSSLAKAIRTDRPEITTMVSYSDPAVGHTGALYRACNWWWAPTWHRLRPPPTGNGQWQAGTKSSVKDRWVYAFRKDAGRVPTLLMKDASILRQHPWATYREPGGACFKTYTSLSALGLLA